MKQQDNCGYCMNTGVQFSAQPCKACTRAIGIFNFKRHATMIMQTMMTNAALWNFFKGWIGKGKPAGIHFVDKEKFESEGKFMPPPVLAKPEEIKQVTSYEWNFKIVGTDELEPNIKAIMFRDPTAKLRQEGL